MINLYQVLNLPPNATPEQILAALHHQSLEPKLNKAVHAWLLDPAVRVRYDTRLYAQEPTFFDAVIPSSFDTATKTTNTTDDTPPLAAHLTLYRPDHACVLGVLFLPCACYMHAVNWQALGNTEKAKQNQYVGGGFLLFILGMVLIKTYAGVHIPTTLGLIWVFVWYYLLGKEQVMFIKEEFDGQYQPKSTHVMGILTVVALMMWQVGNHFV